MTTLDQMELQRQRLEENVAKLQKTLQHWRTWDAEYEGLKEELSASEFSQTEEGCAHISEQLEGELVNKQEILELFGVGKGAIRNVEQVAGLVDRRQDYVQQNIKTISKQLQSEEGQLEKLIVELDQEPGDYNQELPLTEIIEELDEEGNIISTKVSNPETSTAQILETLRKVGMTEFGSESQPTDQASSSITAPESGTTEGQQQETANIASSDEAELSNGAKKGVKFADDVKEVAHPSVDEADEDSEEEASEKPSRTPGSALLSGSFSGNERVIEIDSDDEIVGATSVIPEDESPEDARLRREMLQYNLNEVGSVVAELELEEDYTDDDDDNDFDFDEEASVNSELSEEEDEHGRSTRKGVGSAYRQQMLELEEKLMARMLENVGPDPDEDNPDIDPEDLRKLVIRKDDEMPSAKTIKSALSTPQEKEPNATGKKGVRFAETVDVSEAPTTKKQNVKPQAVKTKSAPIIDNVLERRAPTAVPEKQEEKKSGKVSRFKKARSADPVPATAPANQEPASILESTAEIKEADRPILSNSIVERPSVASTAAPTPDASEFDPEIQQRQLASEYYRMRNNMIRQQGGFKATEDEIDDPLMEERDGKVKKVSRFMAARMK